MAEKLTFIHAADLHIGAPFRGLHAVDERWANRLMGAILESYDKVIQTALDHQADFLVLAGDSFDLSTPSYGEYVHFVEGLEALNRADIQVYLLTGNHDPLAAWNDSYATLPPNVHLFPADAPGFFLYERNGAPLAVLGGRGFAYQSWTGEGCAADGITRDIAQHKVGAKAPFGIGVLHSGLDIDPNRAPVDPKKLAASGMDYWALGHIHTPKLMQVADTVISFSGCVQGRASKETGRRGVNLVTLTQGSPAQVEFIPTASVVYEKAKVNISGAGTLAEVAEMMLQTLFAVNTRSQCDEMVESVTITGATPLHELLSQPGVIDDLRQELNNSYEKFFCDELIDHTKPVISKKALRKEGLLPAAFLQVCDIAKDAVESDAAYLQESFWSRGISLPRAVERRVDKLQDEAEMLVLDMLGGEKL